VDRETGLTLAAAIALGLEREPGLRAAQADVDMARGERQQAGLRPNPMLSLVRQDQVRGRDSVAGFDIEWPLDLFRRGSRVATADRGVAVAEATLADQRRTRAAEIATGYGDLLAAIRRLEVTDELIAIDQQTVTLLRARVREGASPVLEQNMAEVDLRRAEADRFAREAEVEMARIAFARLIGVPVADGVRVRDSLDGALAAFTVGAGSAVPDDRAAVAGRTDVRQALTEVGRADAVIRSLAAEARPDVGVSASVMRMRAGFPQEAFGPMGHLEPIEGRFTNIGVGVTVSLPIRNRNQGMIAAARAGRDRAAFLHEARVLDATRGCGPLRGRTSTSRVKPTTSVPPSCAICCSNNDATSKWNWRTWMRWRRHLTRASPWRAPWESCHERPNSA
jgi:cobalt-zinc-cadmium efflux system outer membrane protein